LVMGPVICVAHELASGMNRRDHDVAHAENDAMLKAMEWSNIFGLGLL
jgi:hypothetical protein